MPIHSELSEYWHPYYTDVHTAGNDWLDYSNARVQSQTFAVSLEAAGSIGGRRCLDAGAGRGTFSRLLHAAGASAVVGIEFVESTVSELYATYPEIHWVCGSLDDRSLLTRFGRFDAVFCLEAIQYLDAASALPMLWDSVNPGGSLVVVVPNGACPIVRKTEERFAGRYRSLHLGQLRSILAPLPHVDHWAVRGLIFGEDQRIVPYVTTPWLMTPAERPDWPTEPNRLMALVRRTQETAKRS